MSRPHIEYLNLTQKFLVLSDNQILEITNMMDGEGDNTDDPEVAESIVAGPDKNEQWWAVNISSLQSGGQKL